MAPIIGFMTAILFCSTNPNPDDSKCNGIIDYFWFSPHDEANCSQQCPSSSSYPIPCDCNKLRNMTCAGKTWVCYNASSKLFVLFYFCKRTMANFGNVTIAVKLNKVSFVSKDCLIVMQELFL